MAACEAMTWVDLVLWSTIVVLAFKAFGGPDWYWRQRSSETARCDTSRGGERGNVVSITSRSTKNNSKRTALDDDVRDLVAVIAIAIVVFAVTAVAITTWQFIRGTQ